MTAEMGQLEGKMNGSVEPGVLSRLLSAIKELDEALEGFWGVEIPLQLEDAVLLWRAVVEARVKMGVHETSLEDLVANLMPEKTAKTTLLELEIKRSASKTTWDTSLLVPAIAQAAMLAPRVNEDGEALTDDQAVVQAILECASIAYFRLGKLDEYGIDGKKYRDVEWGRKRVKVTPIQSPD